MPKQLILLPFLVLLAGGLLFSLAKDRVYKLNLADAPTFEEAGEPITNPNFFLETREKLIREKADFVEADLSAMKLTLYEGGEPREIFPILTKGREGSWWETPAGVYRVGSKAQSHFSSFGQVYQPWSGQFQGNFFIHGWPYYPGGTPVASTYSGGCIRLATEDAKRIFERVETGTPILVFEDSLINGDGFDYGTGKGNKLKKLSSESYLVADLKNNYVLAREDENRALPMGSIANLMIALVATDHMNIEKRVGAYSIYDLLFPMLLESSDSAASAIAGVLGEDRFVKLMNQKAQAIGMTNTDFGSIPESESISTAQNLFDLAKYLSANRSFILKMTTGHLDTAIYGKPAFSGLKNLNLFGDDPRFIGGQVEQGSGGKESFLAVFEISVKGEKRPVAIILFDSLDAEKDTRTVLDYVETNYQL